MTTLKKILKGIVISLLYIVGAIVFGIVYFLIILISALVFGYGN